MPLATVPAHLARFVMDYPATGRGWQEWRLVCQGHADVCAIRGHATYTVDNRVQEWCPRCGEQTVKPGSPAQYV